MNSQERLEQIVDYGLPMEIRFLGQTETPGTGYELLCFLSDGVAEFVKDSNREDSERFKGFLTNITYAGITLVDESYDVLLGVAGFYSFESDFLKCAEIEIHAIVRDGVLYEFPMPSRKLREKLPEPPEGGGPYR